MSNGVVIRVWVDLEIGGSREQVIVVTVIESLEASAGAMQTDFLPGDLKMNVIKKRSGVNAL